MGLALQASLASPHSKYGVLRDFDNCTFGDERVANARNDFQHKLSRQLVDENQAVIVETLNVKNMLKNKRPAHSIADAGWHPLITKL